MDGISHSTMNYAGFWRRLGSLIVDLVIAGLVLVPASHGLEAVGIAMFETAEYAAGAEGLEASASFDLVLTDLGTVAWLVAIWLYAALMEGSARGATLGKRALGLRVTDLAGERIGFARASGRFFAKALSLASLFAGFAMAGFTARKQALHDILASTLVLARS
jgi:uncharacterized RDD family membrane protein YckC